MQLAFVLPIANTNAQIQLYYSRADTNVADTETVTQPLNKLT